MHIKEIRKTQHYQDHHEHEVPWSEVVEAILRSKYWRKKGDKLQIETNSIYVLCMLKNRVLWVLNAKRQKR